LRDAIEAAMALPRSVRGLTLFCTRRGGQPYAYRTVYDMWKRACEVAGIKDAHIHDIRAKSLTEADRQGKNAQALGGHSSAAMTRRYIRRGDTVVAEPPSFGQPLKKLDRSRS
jgi:integrase